MKVKVVNKSKHNLPHYSTIASAGMDLRANIDKSIKLKPLERIIVKTGIFMELPVGYEAQVRPRSGLAYKKGITVLNSPGTVDADYRGEVGVILVNISSDDFLIEDIFSPPLIIGHVTVALTLSLSRSSIVELKSLFSDLE